MSTRQEKVERRKRPDDAKARERLEKAGKRTRDRRSVLEDAERK